MSVNYKPIFDIKALELGEQSNFAEHNQYLGGVQSIDIGNVQIGQVLQFYYNDTARLVYCTNPGYLNDKGKTLLHGLTLHMLDRGTLEAIASELSLAEPPKQFYDRVLREYAPADFYRTYDITKISMLLKVNYDLSDVENE